MSAPKGQRGSRSEASEETRTRILAAARDLAVEEGFSAFTVERVAERAGVSRMTVYYQFGSKPELLDALLDHLAARGRMDRLGEAFRQPDALELLARFIRVFCGFWASDRVGIRRIRNWSALEPEPESAARSRDGWQRRGLAELVGRMREQYGAPAEEEVEEAIDVLHVLLGFESYDRLAGTGRSEEEIAALLERSARRVLGVDR